MSVLPANEFPIHLCVGQVRSKGWCHVGHRANYSRVVDAMLGQPIVLVGDRWVNGNGNRVALSLQRTVESDWKLV